jgi:hypothetical protein
VGWFFSPDVLSTLTHASLPPMTSSTSFRLRCVRMEIYRGVQHRIMRPQRRRHRDLRMDSVYPLTWFVMFHLYGQVGQTLRNTESPNQHKVVSQSRHAELDPPSVLRRVLRVADGEVVGAVGAEQHGEPRSRWAGA